MVHLLHRQTAMPQASLHIPRSLTRAFAVHKHKELEAASGKQPHLWPHGEAAHVRLKDLKRWAIRLK